VRRALVLLLPGARYVVVRRKGILLEDLGVLLDDGNICLELGEAGVTKLVGAGQVRVRYAVRALQVGVEGGDKAVVRVGCNVECTGADVGVLETLVCVVEGRVGLEMLIGALAGCQLRYVDDWPDYDARRMHRDSEVQCKWFNANCPLGTRTKLRMFPPYDSRWECWAR
jgi:hypothetical protein